MKLIIDIDEEDFNLIRDNIKSYSLADVLFGAVKDSEPYEERSQGEWIYHTDGYIAFYTCNICNKFGDKDDKFCSNCGAYMQKG